MILRCPCGGTVRFNGLLDGALLAPNAGFIKRLADRVLIASSIL
jgi:hypothetical protein